MADEKEREDSARDEFDLMCTECGAYPVIDRSRVMPAGGSLRYCQENTKVWMRMRCDCCSESVEYMGSNPLTDLEKRTKLRQLFVIKQAKTRSST